MKQPASNQDIQESAHPLEVTHATIIHAQPSDVYQALTTSAGLDAWFTSGSSVDARAGGEIHFRWENWGPDHITESDAGLVLEAVAPHRFIFQWHPDEPSYATTVEIDISPTENGTIVRLREVGFARTTSGIKAMADCAAGWGEALTLLKFYLEYGVRYS